MIYDPIFDSESVSRPAAAAPTWKASWIWFPGQLAAHLHTFVSQRTFRRCIHIGYPGDFQRPVYYAFFRRQLELTANTPVRWAAPLGRTRMRINGREGDITIREGILPQGRVDLLVTIDMTESLPCFLLEAEGVNSGLGWEASLDGESWVPVEFHPEAGSPERMPDRNIDETLSLRPKQTVRLLHARADNGTFEVEQGGEVLLDFWHDEFGELEIEAEGKAELDVRVGESILEVDDPDPNSGEQIPYSPLQVSARGGVYRLPERLIRFVRIRANAACRISQVRLDARIYPVEYKGSFECSDESLTEIWKAGAATLHSNIHDQTILDGLKRDGLIWLFDQNIDFEGTDCVFFDRKIVHNTLLSVCPPPHPHPTDTGVPDNLMYFVLGCYQDYLASGDESFTRTHRERITDILTLFESLQDERGFIAGRSFGRKAGSQEAGLEGVDYLGEFLPDWGGKSDHGEKRPTDLDCAGIPAYAMMMLMRCFEVGAIFARQWGEEELALRYATQAAQLRVAIRSAFWNAERGAFVNGFNRTGNLDQHFTLYAQAWALLLDLVKPEEIQPLLDGVMADPACRPNNLSMSTYWVYLATIQAGGFERVLDELRLHWGWMLSRGYTRFIEDIRPQDDEKAGLYFYNRPYGLSLNHGWPGATAVSCLIRGTLGLQVMEPAYRLVELRPNWTQFEWAKVTLPTPYGSLALDYTRANGARISLPAGVSAQVADGTAMRTLVGPGTFLIK